MQRRGSHQSSSTNRDIALLYLTSLMSALDIRALFHHQASYSSLPSYCYVNQCRGMNKPENGSFQIFTLSQWPTPCTVDPSEINCCFAGFGQRAVLGLLVNPSGPCAGDATPCQMLQVSPSSPSSLPSPYAYRRGLSFYSSIKLDSFFRSASFSKHTTESTRQKTTIAPPCRETMLHENQSSMYRCAILGQACPAYTKSNLGSRETNGCSSKAWQPRNCTC